MATANSGKHGYESQMFQETEAKTMVLDDDSWKKDFEKQVESHLAGEDTDMDDANPANEPERSFNTPSTPAYWSDAMKILQSNPNGETVKELCKSLEAKLASMSSTRITERGTNIKAQLAPRMTCWGKPQKSRSAEAKIVHHLWASFWGTVKGNYLNAKICDLLHGDISPANMFWYLDEEGRAVGVLNDFDHHNMTRAEYYESHGIKRNHEAKPEETKVSSC